MVLLFVLRAWAVAAPQQGTEVLLNGKDLSNWTFVAQNSSATLEDIWQVQPDGSLLCTGATQSCLTTKKTDYQDYVLTLEWRWKERGNSGVLVHAKERSNPKSVWPRSIEIQLMRKHAGDFVVRGVEPFEAPDMETREKKKGLHKRIADNEKESGEWNLLEVTCRGDEIITRVNGTLVNHATKVGETSGAICLQSEKYEVHFRNMILRPLAQ